MTRVTWILEPSDTSPGAGAGVALEGADDLVGDPAAVEAAGLGADELAVDAAVDPGRVEGVVPGDRGELAYAERLHSRARRRCERALRRLAAG